MPYLPNVLTNFFASRRLHEQIRCETFKPTTAPAACNDAHGDAALWQSWASFVSSSVISFFASPILGAASDQYGRKPFVVLSNVLQIVPILLIVAYSNLHLISLLWYFPVHALCGGLSSMSVTLAAVADALPPENRSVGFGMVLASAASGFIVGPLLGAFMPDQDTAFYSTIGVLVFCLLYTIFVIQETLPRKEEQGARGGAAGAPSLSQPKRGMSAWATLCDSVTALTILNRSPLFRRLSLLIMLSSMCSGGLQEFLFQYLQITLNFQAKDQAGLLVILGIGGVFVQCVLLGPIMQALGEKKTLVFGLAVQIVYYFGISLALSKAEIYASVCLGALGMVTFPSISSLKSNNVDPSEQGKVQGAIVGVQSLAMGVGPLAFSSLFAFFTRAGSEYYLPQAPFILGMALLACALVLAVSVCRLVDQSSAGETLLDSAPADTESAMPERSRVSIEHQGLAGVLNTIKPQRSLINRLSLEEGSALTAPLLSDHFTSAVQSEDSEAPVP